MESSAATSMSLAGRLTVYVLLCGIAAALVAPLAHTEFGGAVAIGIHRFATMAWSSQVLLLVAVLTLAVPSRIVAFQLALLVALLQGYVFAGMQRSLYGSFDQDGFDRQVTFAVIVGLSATLGAVFWLLVRIVWKRTLSDEAADNRGRSGQLGLRELLYVMASLSAVLAFVSLFSFPGLMPADRVLAGTLGFALQTWPLVYLPLWHAASRPLFAPHWLWIVPLTMVYAAFIAEWETWRSAAEVLAGFLGVVLAAACVVAGNGLLLRLLGLHWRCGGEAQKQQSVAA